jgi:hypothetical protein
MNTRRVAGACHAGIGYPSIPTHGGAHVYEFRRLIGNPEIVVDLLVTFAIAAIGLWAVITLLDLPERLRKKKCSSCLQVTRGGKTCQYCGSAV